MRKPFAVHISRSHPTAQSRAAPQTLPAVAAALAACQHPDRFRVSANVIVTTSPVRITWCGDCGAMCSDEDGTDAWQTPALATLLTKSRFAELSATLRAIRQCLALADGASCFSDHESEAGQALHELRSALFELAATPIVRRLEQLDADVARIADLPHRIAS
jgi:hypothetical protein